VRTPCKRAIGLALCALALAVPSSTSASAPTGDAQAIAFNRAVEQAYTTLPGVKMVQRGYLFVRRRGRHFKYGHRRRRHFVSATETFSFALSNGKETAYAVQVKARKVGRFSVLANSEGIFTSDLGGDGCWHKSAYAETVYGPPGQSFISLAGRYYPLKHRGSLVVSRSTFPYGRGSKGLSVATIDPATHQVLSTRLTVTGKTHLSVTQKITAFAMAPTLPVPRFCR
jgi:hypothetical protein